MAYALAAAGNFLLDLFFPIECFRCGIAGTYLCAGCFAAIPIQESFVCSVCMRPSFEDATCADCRKRTKLNGLISACAYETPLVRRLIIAYKYKFVRCLATPLAQLIAKRLSLHNYSVFHRKDVVLVPVPLSPRRERWREFNQAREIALMLSNLLGVPLDDTTLRRTRNTTPQTETASRKERLENISSAFALLRPESFKNRAVVLVDDVATTLVTLSECAQILKKDGGASEVWGLVVAREHFGHAA